MLLDVINVPPPAGLVAVAALPVQLADEPRMLIFQLDPEASPPVLVGTSRFVRAPAAVVDPVPPLPTTKVPARVIAPPVAVEGVRPVEPALKLVTPEEIPDHARVPLPLVDRKAPAAPSATGRV
jgi:hypothetical protein